MTEMKAMAMIDGRLPRAMVEEMRDEDCWTRDAEEKMGLSPEFAAMVEVEDDDLDENDYPELWK